MPAGGLTTPTLAGRRMLLPSGVALGGRPDPHFRYMMIDRKPIDAMTNEEMLVELGKLDLMAHKIDRRREAILEEVE